MAGEAVPAEDLTVIFMTQLLPSGTFNFRGQLKTLVYRAITDCRGPASYPLTGTDAASSLPASRTK